MSAHFEDISVQNIDFPDGGNSAVQNVSGWTIATWSYSFFNQAQQHIDLSIDDTVPTGSTRTGFTQDSGGPMQVQARVPDSGSFTTNTGSITPTEDEWWFSCGITDVANDEMRIYTGNPEGTTLTEDTFSETFTPTATDNTPSRSGSIGSDADGSGGNYNGLLAEIMVFNRALTATEVQTLYSMRGPPPSHFGLVHRFILNEGPPTSEITAPKDSGSIGTTLTPNNAPIYGFEHPLRINRRSF